MWIAFGFFLAFAIGFGFGMMVEGTLAAAEQADQQIENIPEQPVVPVRSIDGVLADRDFPDLCCRVKR